MKYVAGRSIRVTSNWLRFVQLSSVILAVLCMCAVCVDVPGAGCSSQMCQYERMQILGIRHPLPPTTTDTESAAGLSYHVIATCVHLVVCLSTGTWIHFLLEFDSNSSNKQNLGLWLQSLKTQTLTVTLALKNSDSHSNSKITPTLNSRTYSKLNDVHGELLKNF